MTRRRRDREVPEYAAFARRTVRALGARLAEGDPVDLVEIERVRKELDAALDVAVKGQRAAGFSWSEIGVGLGTTRQAAQQRFR